ncbi:MAG: 1-acyl-sn-glycerol-3-phosphate acyltransferase [Clostridiales bacterium]|nr:1-acyl-sn-glycerol-3-phosphate acyltransferase [Clostridiales bacterium]MCD7828054.1 1-acyl-sn-glycerol-3-phosphate acyltransferase [Clostridiales bacterium]
MSDNKNVRKGYTKNRVVLNTARVLFGGLLLKVCTTKVDYYKPKHTPFIIIANHSDPLDPGFEMIALKRYIRFVASDHLARAKVGGWIITHLGGVIVKHRDKPSSMLTQEIIDNINAGISVGIHAEGKTSTNGETGYISEHTGKLVKDSGAALITFKFTGGYLRAPRWSSNTRKGPLHGRVVNEYSPEELSKLSVSEITDIIRRDTFVNVYDEQRKNPHMYKGIKLAEYVERTLYICPKCNAVGDLHSKNDILKCTNCGCKLKFGEDAFFHDTGDGIVFDNVCDWDKWQKNVWKEKVLAASEGELIFSEGGQIVADVHSGDRVLLSDNADIMLYKDKFVIAYDDKSFEIPMDTIKSVQIASREALIIISRDYYFDIRTQIPRAAGKYEAAWRYLTGREYL